MDYCTDREIPAFVDAASFRDQVATVRHRVERGFCLCVYSNGRGEVTVVLNRIAAAPGVTRAALEAVPPELVPVAAIDPAECQRLKRPLWHVFGIPRTGNAGQA